MMANYTHHLSINSITIQLSEGKELWTRDGFEVGVRKEDYRPSPIAPFIQRPLIYNRRLTRTELDVGNNTLKVLVNFQI